MPLVDQAHSLETAGPGISATHSISMSAPIGSFATPTHVRAGIIAGVKNFDVHRRVQRQFQLGSRIKHTTHLNVHLIHGLKVALHIGQVDVSFNDMIEPRTRSLQDDREVIERCALPSTINCISNVLARGDSTRTVCAFTPPSTILKSFVQPIFPET